MNAEEKKAWEALANQAEWCKELARNQENLPEAQRAILAAAAELTRLRATEARCGDVEGMAAIICCDVCQSPEGVDELWESVPNSVKENWRETALAVSRFLKERK